MRVARWMIGVGVLAVFLGAGGATTMPVMPVAAETFEVGTLRVEKFGVGKRSIVLIPGLACGTWVWGGTIERFGKGHTIYAVTLPGFDGRAATEKRPLFATVMGDFWGLLESRKIEKPVVVGHSLGGTLAIALAEEHPERLSGIVAVDGLPVFPQAAWVTAEERKGMGARMVAMYAGLTHAQEVEQERAYMKTIGTMRAELVEWTAEREAGSDASAVGAWMAEDLENDFRPGLGKIAVPFLEILPYNKEDAKPPMDYTEEQTVAFYRSLVAGAPRVRVKAIVPSRHFVMLDQPEAFYGEVAGFLEGVGR